MMYYSVYKDTCNISSILLLITCWSGDIYDEPG